VERSILRMLALLAAPALMLAVVACSSNNNNNASNAGTVNNKANTAATAAVAGPPVTPGPPPPGSTPGAAPTITEVMTDNAYSVTNMVIPAGKPVTVIADNRGAIHNWHVLGVTDDSGKTIQTPLMQGPRTDSITFTISKPGTYQFQCDAHPADMKGTLTVQ
jgi:plastocyanin